VADNNARRADTFRTPPSAVAIALGAILAKGLQRLTMPLLRRLPVPSPTFATKREWVTEEMSVVCLAPFEKVLRNSAIFFRETIEWE
jgi:hypothetical protein